MTQLLVMEKMMRIFLYDGGSLNTPCFIRMRQNKVIRQQPVPINQKSVRMYGNHEFNPFG
jgi:hypothetical protein